VKENKLILFEEVYEGIRSVENAIQDLFLGQNIGKILVWFDSESYQDVVTPKLWN